MAKCDTITKKVGKTLGLWCTGVSRRVIPARAPEGLAVLGESGDGLWAQTLVWSGLMGASIRAADEVSSSVSVDNRE